MSRLVSFIYGKSFSFGMTLYCMYTVCGKFPIRMYKLEENEAFFLLLKVNYVFSIYRVSSSAEFSFTSLYNNFYMNLSSTGWA